MLVCLASPSGRAVPAATLRATTADQGDLPMSKPNETPAPANAASIQAGHPVQQPATPIQDLDSYAWLRGYFSVMSEADVQGGSRVANGRWKNLDFLRLRDMALHLLDPGPGRTILDIGCADGATMVYC